MRPEGFTPDVVFAIRPVAFCVGWVAINQMVIILCVSRRVTRFSGILIDVLQIPPGDTTSKAMPHSYWMASDAADLTFFRRTSEQIRHVMDRVDFRSELLAQSMSSYYYAVLFEF